MISELVSLLAIIESFVLSAIEDLTCADCWAFFIASTVCCVCVSPTLIAAYSAKGILDKTAANFSASAFSR
ncbi:MAG: hypothetical protein BWY38_03271 [Ignavibacteria bacterium ADurb.Bin266]|nr:MAG: hypothetical protein BWY38_03271 [Ignavibacteria bacterium ADurb.Bin266]